MEQPKKCYVWTYNDINSFVFYSKEECLKNHEEYKQSLKETLKTCKKYEENDNNRECPSFGVFEIFSGRNVLNTKWCETYIK